MIEILPTNTCPPDVAELSRRSEVFASFAPSIQLDVGDGTFVPEASWPCREGQWSEFEAMVAKGEKLPFSDTVRYEVHLMVQDPLRLGGLLARAGCMRVIPHVEVFDGVSDIRSAIDSWKADGASEVGLALLLGTPLSAIESVANSLDVVQLMSIGKLGYQGAPFEPSVIQRIEEVHAAHPELPIEIDGGVSKHTITELVRAGATRFGVGSAISKAPDPKAAYEELRALAESAVH